MRGMGERGKGRGGKQGRIEVGWRGEGHGREGEGRGGEAKERRGRVCVGKHRRERSVGKEV